MRDEKLGAEGDPSTVVPSPTGHSHRWPKTSSVDHPVAIRQGKVLGPSRQPGQEQVEMGPATGLETRLLTACVQGGQVSQVS